MNAMDSTSIDTIDRSPASAFAKCRWENGPLTTIGAAVAESKSVILRMIDIEEMPVEAIGSMIESHRRLKEIAAKLNRQKAELAEREEENSGVVTDAKLHRWLNGSAGLGGEL